MGSLGIVCDVGSGVDVGLLCFSRPQEWIWGGLVVTFFLEFHVLFRGVFGKMVWEPVVATWEPER